MRPGRLERLLQVSRKQTRTIVGLMSGTSLDGVDAALCEIRGQGMEVQIALKAYCCIPFPRDLREQLEDAMTRGGLGEVCVLNVMLGELFADAVEAVAKRAQIELSSIDLVASHGQTLFHIDRAQGPVPSTLQLGEPAVIAERTGCLVVSDFRPRDIAAGGAGAPLVAYLDYCLFAREGAPRVLQNIGGIANLTVVSQHHEDLLAFDTGPGNLVIDEVCRELTGAPDAFDRDGAYSKLGEVDGDLLAELLEHEYLSLSPPKTTGREAFGREFSRALIERYDSSRIIDLLATVVRFTALSIAGAYRSFVLPVYGAVAEVIISGGGVHNLTLMSALREELWRDGIRLRSFDDLDLGFGADAKEAVAFALLGNQTVLGLPSNLPAATGARAPVVLGKITL